MSSSIPDEYIKLCRPTDEVTELDEEIDTTLSSRADSTITAAARSQDDDTMSRGSQAEVSLKRRHSMRRVHPTTYRVIHQQTRRRSVTSASKKTVWLAGTTNDSQWIRALGILYCPGTIH